MPYEKVSDLSTDNVTKLGGYNEKTKKNNPTSMEGYYLGFRTVQTVNGDAKIHVFQTPKGNVGVWGSKDINDKLCQVKIGTMALAEFTGKKRLQGGKTLNTFTVSQDKSNVLEVSTLEVGSSTAPVEANDDYVYDESEGLDTEDQDAIELAAATKAAAQQAKVQEILNRGKAKKA
jgi:hypothetical protein